MGDSLKTEGVGVMKDKELKLEETETSLTIGGVPSGTIKYNWKRN
jgi:hypothetical protein